MKPVQAAEPVAGGSREAPHCPRQTLESTFAGKPECSQSVIQIILPLGKSTLDRVVFSHHPEHREEREGGSQQMASGKAICPAQGSGSLAGGTLPTLTCLPPLGATRGCMDRLAGTSSRTEPQTLASHWMGPWGNPGLLPSQRGNTHALDAPEEKPAFPKSWRQKRKSQRSLSIPCPPGTSSVSHCPGLGSAWF